MVGPFVFFDHMGPLDLAPGFDRSLDVRPHPHIGLSTVTYLFAGEVMHRDSLGYEQAIRPQEVNWMTAGRGITHSERLERASCKVIICTASRPGSRYRPNMKRARLPSPTIPEATFPNGTTQAW
nr:pirin family protein [Bradyrhizobium sp. Leo170]